MKGGVAKTTLAVNMADVLARRHGYSVLLIDIDPQFNATQCLISGKDYIEHLKKGVHTIVDIFDEAPRMIPSAVKNASIREPTPLENITPWQVKANFDIILGDLDLYRLDMAPGQGREQRLKRLIEHFDKIKNYDIVLIDTPPTPSVWMHSALLASDSYLIPVKPEPLSRGGLDLLKGVIKRMSNNYGKKLECLGVVFTIADTSHTVYQETCDFIDNDKTWHRKRFRNVLPRRTEIAREQGQQKLILDLKNESAKHAIVTITQELLEKLSHG
jgi:chromosome partitioning protein